MKVLRFYLGRYGYDLVDSIAIDGKDSIVNEVVPRLEHGRQVMLTHEHTPWILIDQHNNQDFKISTETLKPVLDSEQQPFWNAGMS